MAEPGEATSSYTSTVVAPAQIVLGFVSGAVAAVILIALKSALWPVAVLAFVFAVGIGTYLAVVRLIVEPGRVTLGQGRGEREQRIVYASELLSAQARRLSWAQCFGIGMPDADRATRLSVRAGDALVLITRGDELIAVSTPDAQRALQVLTNGTSIPPAPLRAVEAPVAKPRPRPARPPAPESPPNDEPAPPTEVGRRGLTRRRCRSGNTDQVVETRPPVCH